MRVDNPAENTTICGNAATMSSSQVGLSRTEPCPAWPSMWTTSWRGTVYGTSRPDVATVRPHAPARRGWTFVLDSNRLANGSHTIDIHAADASNNEAILPPLTLP